MVEILQLEKQETFFHFKTNNVIIIFWVME